MFSEDLAASLPYLAFPRTTVRLSIRMPVKRSRSILRDAVACFPMSAGAMACCLMFHIRTSLVKFCLQRIPDFRSELFGRITIYHRYHEIPNTAKQGDERPGRLVPKGVI